MNDTLKRIIAKHAEPQADLLDQRTPASQLARWPKGVCPHCGAHGIAARCPFSSDDVIVSNLAAMIVEEFSIRDAGMLVRLLCTEGPRIGLELHEALNAPEEG